MEIVSILTGAAGMGLLWFLKLAGAKAVPAALAWIRAKRSASKPDLSSLQGDIAAAHGKVDALRSSLGANFASVYAEIDELKAKLGLPIGTAGVAAAPVPPKPPACLQEKS